MEHVHNRRQTYMTNSLLDIGARDFGIVTPASRYRRVIIDILRLYIYQGHVCTCIYYVCTRNQRFSEGFFLLRKIIDVIYSKILPTLEKSLIYLYIYKYITCTLRVYIGGVYIYIMTRLYLEASVSIPKARATISNKLLVIDFWRRL